MMWPVFVIERPTVFANFDQFAKTVDHFFYVYLNPIFIMLVCIAVCLLPSLFKQILRCSATSSGPVLAGRFRLWFLAFLIYTLASVFIGPFIAFDLDPFILGYDLLYVPDSLYDCSDKSARSTTFCDRETAYRTVRTVARLVAGIMFLLGFMLVVLLEKLPRKTFITTLAKVIIIFILCGYGAILALVDWVWMVFHTDIGH